MKTLRIGFLGGGEIAHKRSAPGARRAAGVELRAMADVSPAVREQWRKEAEGLRIYEDPAALVTDPELDAIYVALPNHLHKEWVLRAARAGKHVICEKPLAMSAADALEMVEGCDKAGVVLMAAYMALFNPLIPLLSEHVRSGRLGRLQHVHGQYAYSTWPREGFWRMDAARGGGPLADVGIYLLLAIRHVTGQVFTEVSALGAYRRFPEGGPPDVVAACGRLADGTLVTLETAFTHGGNFIRFDGEEGALVLDNVFTQLCEGRLHGAASGVRVDLTVQAEHVFREQNYQREFEHLAECVRTGQEPLCSGRAALADCAAMEALYRALRSGQREPVAAFPA